MNVTRLKLSGHAAGTELALDRVSPRLNVISGPPQCGKTAVAELLAHLLYGRPFAYRNLERSSGRNVPEGSVFVAGGNAEFILRRHRDGSPQGRLTVATADGSAVDRLSVQRLLGGAPPQLLGQLYAVDFAAGPRIEDLFAPEFARQFNALATSPQTLENDQESRGRGEDERQQTAAPGGPWATRHKRAVTGELGQQLDRLIARRDELALQLEGQLSGGRQHSGDLQRQLADLQLSISDRRRQREDLLAELQRLQAERAGLATRLRYYALEAAARRPLKGDAEALQQELVALDAEVARCRQTLADLQQREATLRRELAEVHPDGVAHAEESLADQRATLTVIERLLADLDAETAQLARTADADERPGLTAHARVSPLADMLRQQVYTLCGQITEQERSVRRQRLKAEALQVSRAQTDLAHQLEHLLDNRQGLLHRQRLETQAVLQYPLAPVDAHCQCEHHGRFVVESDAMLLGRGDPAKRTDAARRDAAELEATIARLESKLETVNRELSDQQRAWERLQRQRAGLLGPEAIDRLRAELGRLETEIERLLSCGCDRRESAPVAGWRASDILAQLTNGRLVQIRGQRTSEVGEVVDRDGRRRTFAELTPAERDQAYLAVTLALASSHSAGGAKLPLILDEPFLRQSPADAAAMAGVLADFAERGMQVFVATADRDALDRFAALGSHLLPLDSLAPEPRFAERVAPAPPQPEPETRTTVRIVRSADDGSAPVLRVAGGWSEEEGDRSVYYLTEDASLGDFPVLGGDTAARFKAINIRTTGELLAADPHEVSTALRLPTVTPAVVRLWQTHMRLMCFVPGVSLNDAQLLAACRITTPDDLAAADVDDLAATVDALLASERGRRFAAHGDRFSRDQLRAWRRAAERRGDRWRRSPAFASWQRRRAEQPQTSSGEAAQNLHVRPRLKKREAARPRRPQRFFLELTSPVVDAPAIGEKLAETLAQAGIRTVADLLNCDPASVAGELSGSRVTAERLRDWQHQARLVCRIPELRGYAAQLFVACGLTTPEQIAGAAAEDLVAKLSRFCKTKEGQRILRNSPAPTREKVVAWIANAGRTRSLGAA